MSLTPPERETIVSMTDADDVARIWTAQRTIITKLPANPAATLIEEGTHDGTAWARFEIPAALLTFRTRRREMTDDQRSAAADRLRQNLAARQEASSSV